ncbi:unnamed protein product, partial [Dibothriocephalus latus]
MGAELCTPDGRTSWEKIIRLDLPEHIVEDSLRTYVSVSGVVLGNPMENLDNLLNYRHENGSFSVFKQDKPGSTWLMAYVFGVFSEAERLLQEKVLEELRTANVNFDPTLSAAFTFLKAMQREDGCFVEYGLVPHSDLQAPGSSQKAKPLNDLLLTSYVLSALVEAPPALKKHNSQLYATTVASAGRCLLRTLGSFKDSEISLKALAKVAFALRSLTEQPEYLEKRELVYGELINRSS